MRADNGDTLEIYRWGVFDVSNGTAPVGLDVELLDDSDTVQGSANTTDNLDRNTPIALYENTSGDISISKLRAHDTTGGAIGTPSVGAHFGYRVI